MLSAAELVMASDTFGLTLFLSLWLDRFLSPVGARRDGSLSPKCLLVVTCQVKVLFLVQVRRPC